MESTYLSILIALVLGVIGVVIILLKPAKPTQRWFSNENYYKDPASNKTTKFPSLANPHSVHLSVIVPAYFEESRISKMLDETITFLEAKTKQNKQYTWEIIIVDDGSTDRTSSVSLEYVKKHGTDRIRLLSLSLNRGKGGAVQRGMLCARGKYLLFADADGATDINDLDRLMDEVSSLEKTSNGKAIGIGSRAHMVHDVVAKRSLIRNILMWGFHLFVKIVGVPTIKDTQCGFKLFTRSAALDLFPNIHIERWAFDVELLWLARKKNIAMKEIAVNWKEIPGSKMSLVGSSLQMARDMFRIRCAYLSGIWKIDNPL